MAKGTIKIKLKRSKMIALNSAVVTCISKWYCENDHEVLLLHHLKLFGIEYRQKLQNEQNNYGVTFDEIKTLAFCQIFDKVPLDYLKYEGVIVQEILDEIDKHRKRIEATLYE